MDRKMKQVVGFGLIMGLSLMILPVAQSAAEGPLEVPAAQRVYLMPTGVTGALEAPASQRIYLMPRRGSDALEAPAAQRVYLLPRRRSDALEAPASQRVYLLPGRRSDALEAPASQRIYLLPITRVNSGALEVEPRQRLYLMPAAQTAAVRETGIRWFEFDASLAAVMAFFTLAGIVIGWVFGRRTGGMARRPSHAVGK